MVGDDDQSIYAFRGAEVATWPTSQREYRRQADHQAGAELPLLRQHPRLGQRADRAQRAAPGQEALRTEAGAGRAGARVRVDQRLRRGAMAAGGNPGAAPRRPARSEIALLYRSNAQSRVLESALFNAGMPYRVYRRPALLRACRGQACAGLPAADREPERRHQLPARGELPHARHRRAHDRAAAGRRARQRPQPGPERGGRGGQGRWQPGGLRRAGGCDARRDTRADAARDHRSHAACLGPARLLPHRQGRPGSHREPGGTGQRRGGLRHAGRLRQGCGGAADRRARRRAGAGPHGGRRRPRQWPRWT